MHLWRTLVASVPSLLLTLWSTTLWAYPIEGTWQTFDEDTGEPKSLIKIYVDEEKLYGKIVEIFPEEGEDPDPVCEKCRGEHKNQKIIGMVIIDGLEEENGTWTGGKILDPENGKSYRCKLWLEDDNLRVRGSLFVFHRTQTWVRAASGAHQETDVAGAHPNAQDTMRTDGASDSIRTRPE